MNRRITSVLSVLLAMSMVTAVLPYGIVFAEEEDVFLSLHSADTAYLPQVAQKTLLSCYWKGNPCKAYPICRERYFLQEL